MAAGIRYWVGAIETVLALWIGWILVFVVPFRWTSRRFGGAVTPTVPDSVPSDRIARARDVVDRLQRVARHLPWPTTCLVRAVAGRLLLRRRGIPSTIRLGVNKTGAGLAAHAWLIVGDAIVLGGEISPDYRAIADMGGNAP